MYEIGSLITYMFNCVVLSGFDLNQIPYVCDYIFILNNTYLS